MFRNIYIYIYFCEEFSSKIKVNFDVENENFENVLFNPFDSQNILGDENNDPDINFFNKKTRLIIIWINLILLLRIFSKIHFLFCISIFEV